MPYVMFATYPAAPGRSYRGAATDPDSGQIACEVDAVADGEVEIHADRYAAIVAAAEQYEIDHPPVVPDSPEPQPSPFEQLVSALAAEPALSQDTKTAIMAISGGEVVSDRVVPMTPKGG